jgi:hypothetical protein
MGIYDRPVRGSDVLARAQSAGIDVEALARMRQILDPAAVVADLEELARQIPPAGIGISMGAWAHAFAPLFGEFE